MTQEATPIIITKLRSDGSNAGQVFDMVFEGEFGTDTYDGSNSEAFAAYLQTVVKTVNISWCRSSKLEQCNCCSGYGGIILIQLD